MHNLSIDLAIIDPTNTDAVPSPEMTELAAYCSRLRTITLHLLTDDYYVHRTFQLIVQREECSVNCDRA